MERRSEPTLFSRYEGNPIISVKDLPYPATAIFNTGAARVGDETLLLVRVEDRRGISHLAVARSKDGESGWRIASRPTLAPDPDGHPEERRGIGDARITYLEEREEWAIVYTAYSRTGAMVSLATTRDFERFERHGSVLPPENKNAALFPVRFDGRWAMLHRPVSAFSDTGNHIWLSYSPDLVHWGDHRPLVRARRDGWDAGSVSLSPPPLRTEMGWLLLYHSVRETVGGVTYRLGLAMLDLDDPAQVIARSDAWLFGPEEDYELLGDVEKGVLPCGWIAEGQDVHLYYGASENGIALATAKMPDLLDWLGAHNSLEE